MGLRPVPISGCSSERGDECPSHSEIEEIEDRYNGGHGGKSSELSRPERTVHDRNRNNLYKQRDNL